MTTTEDRAEHIEPVSPQTDPPSGSWMREAVHFPVPPSPAMRSLFPALTAASSNLGEELGMLIDGAEYRTIGGWAYLRIVPVGDKRGPVPPPWMFPVLLRVVPALRRRVRAAERALRDDVPGQVIERWYGQWRDRFATRVRELQVDLAGLSDAELKTHLDASVALLSDAGRLHFRLHGPIAVILADLAFFCHDKLGWDDASVLDLLAGTSATSTRPAKALAEVAALARGGAVRHLLDSAAAVEDVLRADPAFAAAFEEYRRTFGCRALRYEVAEPTLAENPVLLRQLIHDQLATGYDPDAPDPGTARAERAITAARRALNGDELSRFDRLLTCARRAYPVREDNEFFTVSAPYALVRYALLELGRRLVARGALQDRDDVFQLEIPEAVAALRDGDDRRTAVRRSRGEAAWAIAHPGPEWFGPAHAGEPPFDKLPPAARFVNRAFLWSFALMSPDLQVRSRQEETLSGIAAAPGTYRGPVRVIRDESEFGRIRAGDVLVCPITSPVWSVLFPSIGALVTDTGGILSHPAIIAREFGIAAVVATGNATQHLHDGQIVVVDGTTGTVRVEP